MICAPAGASGRNFCVPLWYGQIGMKKPELAKRLAKQSHSTVGEAADRLDRIVGEIVRKLKQGESARLPGVGAFTRSRDGRVDFEPERKGRD
jgi:nucleoid DNA-binding protein